MVLDLDEELLHGEDVVGDVERADGDEERRVVQADQLAQHLATDVALGECRVAFFWSCVYLIIHRSPQRHIACPLAHPDAGEDEVDEVGGQRGEPRRLEVDELDLGRLALGGLCSSRGAAAAIRGGGREGLLVRVVGWTVFEEDVGHQLTGHGLKSRINSQHFICIKFCCY